MKKFLVAAVLTITLFVYPLDLFAQEEQKAPQEVKTADESQRPQKYVYETPTVQKFSRLYWALNMMDIKNDKLVDNFLMINECDIYKDYFFNEFEWKTIRQSGRQFLEQNKDKFPLRFEIVQPLFFGEYNMERKSFEILPAYQMKNTLRLEVLPNDYATPVCLNDQSNSIKKIEGYPLGVIIEFNRPIHLMEVQVEPDVAKKFIDAKMEAFKKLKEQNQNAANMSKLREAYVFAQVKFFAYKETSTNSDGIPVAETMAVLEGLEVYADRNKKQLLFAQNFRKARPKQKKAATPETETTETPATTGTPPVTSEPIERPTQ